MRNLLVIARREISSTSSRPCIPGRCGLSAVSGFLLTSAVLATQQADMGHLRHHDRDALLISPALTMRLLSEEQRTGPRSSCSLFPCERSRSSPANTSGHCAAAGHPLPTWSICCCSHPRNPDYGPVVWATRHPPGQRRVPAIGLFASSLSQNQIVAAVLASPSRSCSGCCSRPTPSPPALRRPPDLPEPFGAVRQLLPRPDQTEAVVYLLSVIVAFLFFTTRVLESADGARPRPQRAWAGILLVTGIVVAFIGVGVMLVFGGPDPVSVAISCRPRPGRLGHPAGRANRVSLAARQTRFGSNAADGGGLVAVLA